MWVADAEETSEDCFGRVQADIHHVDWQEQLTSDRGVSLDRDNVMALAVQSSNRGSCRSDSRPKTNGIFSYYHRSGHDITICFSKNGFPDWWRNRPRGSGRGAGLKPVGTVRTGGRRHSWCESRA
ncbi:hypothetical protein LIER_38833 [Lithospermum erythrorhizon]|uniref:Uncharacterized protein n=1 Tax=Lithospermum erythrorhizon TaxID=34254 RepID=A0AAV3Q6Y5_LITER